MVITPKNPGHFGNWHQQHDPRPEPHAVCPMTKYDKLTVAQREQIGNLAKTRPCVSSVARSYRCSPSAVRRWLAEGRKRHPNYNNKPGQGRPRKLTVDQGAKIRQRTKGKRSSSNIHKGLRLHPDKTVSTRTIQRTVNRGRIPYKWQVLARGKHLSAKNKSSRVRFCRRYVHTQAHNWVFLDAKYLYLYRDNQRYVHSCWQRADREPETLPAGSPTVFLFYGAVARGFKSNLYFVAPTPPPGSKARKGKENFSSKHFIEVMAQLKVELSAWFGTQRYRIIRDHAKQHTSKVSTAAMEGLELPILLDYPAMSWDLNVIENVWGMLDGQLLGSRANTNDGWRRRIQRAWDKISQGSIDKLVDSVPSRIKAVVQKGGEWLKGGK